MSDPITAERVTELLSKRGWKGITQLKSRPPTYHFDIGVSAGGINDTFEWTASQLLLVCSIQNPILADIDMIYRRERIDSYSM